MPGYSRGKYLEEYELRLDKEFELDGTVATWAPGHDGPRFWDDEDDLIQPGEGDADKGERPSSRAALTPDGRYLAVSTNLVIEIYEIESLALCSRIVGHQSNVTSLTFVGAESEVSAGEQAGYALLSEASPSGVEDCLVHTWRLDRNGALQRDLRAKPLPVEKLADDAINAIAAELTGGFEVDFADLTTIRAGFLETLKAADAHNQAKRIPTIKGIFSGFGTQPVSHSGDKALCIKHGGSTQQGMRPPEALPQVVIVDIATGAEKCRLKGHEDAIMWVGWSLDDTVIATACWDETFRLWDAETGECRHVIGKTGGQNWAGAFLPDGKHVLLSGGQPVEVGIYDIATAEKVTSLSPPSGTTLDHWMRYFVVHPAENLIALQNSVTLLAWRPNLTAQPASGPEVQEIFALARGENMILDHFNAVYELGWADDGRKLLAQGTEGTTYVWDMEKGLKWRFQRPKGRQMDVYGGDVFLVRRHGAEWVAARNGDGKVRFWKM